MHECIKVSCPVKNSRVLEKLFTASRGVLRNNLIIRQHADGSYHPAVSSPVPRALVFLGHARARVDRSCGGAIVRHSLYTAMFRSGLLLLLVAGFLSLCMGRAMTRETTTRTMTTTTEDVCGC